MGVLVAMGSLPSQQHDQAPYALYFSREMTKARLYLAKAKTNHTLPLSLVEVAGVEPRTGAM